MNTVMTDPDKIAMEHAIDSSEEGANYFCEVSDNIVNNYTSHLDEIMCDMYHQMSIEDIPDTALERYALELNNALYYIGNTMEKMGIRDDVSKIAAKEVYNNAYLNYVQTGTETKTKKTVAELTALAEDDSKYETIINNIYSRAYKQIKYKVDAGYEMLSTIKKIISKHMQDQQLSMMQRDTLNIISEE